jgi:prepilin-type N-terminal cleavage/methylation domain-containing protein
MPRRLPAGYTLIEIVVAMLLFTVGALALVATSALIGSELSANAIRERAGRIAETRLEILGAACRGATEGREVLGRIESEWSVGFADSGRVSLVESITYPTRRGGRTDSYRVTLPCPP